MGPTSEPLGAHRVPITPSTMDSLARYYECDAGKVWLSRKVGRVTQCVKDSWTPIYDICDDGKNDKELVPFGIWTFRSKTYTSD